ncbi:MAG: PIN domain-containing protein, partial [Selenomonadaceae bacterium]|nr:PIN domain-containing protein [Selenomonadaceae bacterium]
MNLLIDSNVIIDVLNNREPFYNTSSVIWNYCETNDKVNGYISTLTFANVVYIVRKKIEKRKVNIFYKSMKKIFEFIDFTEKDIEKASEMQWL